MGNVADKIVSVAWVTLLNLLALGNAISAASNTGSLNAHISGA